MGLEWFGTRFLNYVDKQWEKQAHAFGDRVVAIAKTLAPVDTGYLRDHIYWTYIPATRTLSIHADAFYSMHQEYGTYKMRPHPYLRPALLAAGKSFFSNFNVRFQMETNSPFGHTPLKIHGHIRPGIASANKRFNRGLVRKTDLTAVHVRQRRGNMTVLHTTSSSLSKIHKLRRAWN